MTKGILAIGIMSVALLVACGETAAKPANAPSAEGAAGEERSEGAGAEALEQLGRAVSQSKATLKQGLKAAEAQGQPISAKFELEEGKLQLSVYTQKGGAFSEVVIDHDTGATAETEAITGGEDLEAAQAQSKVMSVTKSSLASAVEKAEADNAGYRAVSVFPEGSDGHQSAKVTLAKGEETKTVLEDLP